MSFFFALKTWVFCVNLWPLWLNEWAGDDKLHTPGGREVKVVKGRSDKLCTMWTFHMICHPEVTNCIGVTDHEGRISIWHGLSQACISAALFVQVLVLTDEIFCLLTNDITLSPCYLFFMLWVLLLYPADFWIKNIPHHGFVDRKMSETRTRHLFWCFMNTRLI